MIGPVFGRVMDISLRAECILCEAVLCLGARIALGRRRPLSHLLFQASSAFKS